MMKRLDAWIRSGKGARVDIGEGWRKELAARYGAGNAGLASACGLDLQRYGYVSGAPENAGP
jgi:hypothetical protein